MSDGLTISVLYYNMEADQGEGVRQVPRAAWAEPAGPVPTRDDYPIARRGAAGSLAMMPVLLKSSAETMVEHDATVSVTTPGCRIRAADAGGAPARRTHACTATPSVS